MTTLARAPIGTLLSWLEVAALAAFITLQSLHAVRRPGQPLITPGSLTAALLTLLFLTLIVLCL